jgi:hypothetical protein
VLFLGALLRHAARDDRAVRGRVAGAGHRRLPAADAGPQHRLRRLRDRDPAFLTIVLMPFTYSITNGIGAGFVSYAVLKATQGKAREVSPLLWVIAALFVVYFAIDPIEAALT